MANMSIEDILRMVRGKPPVTKGPKLPSAQVQELILKALQIAFDEGGESPYELRDSATKKILTEFMPKLEGLQEDSKKCPMPSKAERRELAKALGHTMPIYVVRSMMRTRCYFAGGALISQLINGTWGRATDCDLFVHKADLDQLPFKLTKTNDSKKEYSSLAKIDQVYVGEPDLRGQRHLDATKYNIITGDFNGPSDVVRQFDFRFLQVCMFISEKSDYLHDFEIEFYSHEAWNDLLAAEIHLTETGLESLKKAKIRERIRKYIARGFADRTGLVDNGPLTKLAKSMLEATKCK